MKIRIWLFSALSGSLLYAVAAHAGPAYYVQSASAKIMAEPSFKSSVIAEAEMGKMLDSTGSEGSWIKVTLGSKSGYVPSLLLSTHPPLKKTQLIKAEDPDIKLGVRRRTSSFSSAAAARGLTKEDRERADIEDRVDFKALDNMESLTISDDEVAKFIAGEQP